MLKDIFKNYIYPIAVMSGSIIGVGFLSLPYITSKVGIFIMLFYFVFLTALVICLHLIFTDITLKTPDFKRFPGFVGFHLGAWAERVTLVLMIFGAFGILLVYLIVGGQFLTSLLSPFLGGSLLDYIILFFAVLSFILYFGIKTISKIEFWALSLFAILFAIIFIKGASHINFNNFFLFPEGGKLTAAYFFMPYGAILFSLWGTGLIPEVEEMMRGKKKLLKKVIVISTLIPAIIYLLFVFLVVSITGPSTTESALVGLESFFGRGVFSLALFIGVITTFTAFVTQGLLLKKMFMYDMNIKEFPAWVFTCFVPLILFLLGFNSFLSLISFIGGVFLGINGIFILLIYNKIGGKKILMYPLALIFILGMI
ncbi:MAG: Tryptophan/tyrosine permease family [Parcubacteria group bacterium GW2011_GWA2_33_14]|nr:MAG: Tryptophan/tyrosine permease family [Parcubacteria group bacterium GW2011_GWA2_33_14]